jgi:two-component system chemotaxis family response regulator WspR
MPDGRIVVLLVDDQPIVGEAIRRALADATSIEFYYCADPYAAVETAERIRPSVILQDLMMPGISGLTLVREYRSNAATADVPIIVLTMEDDAAIKNEAFACGVNDYLVKLPNSIELIARIRHHAIAYLSRIERDEAHRELRESQRLLLEQNLQLERLTNVDGLTGLSNRRYFDEFTSVQWKLAIRAQCHFSILMIDVDDFKHYNDTYGHLAGDVVLKHIGETIKSCCNRPADIVARFGGEEFVVSLTAPLGGTRIVGEKVCFAIQSLEIPHGASTVADRVTVSIGGATTLPVHGEPYLPLIEAADVALYDAKRSGKNRVIVRAHARAGAAASPRADEPIAEGSIAAVVRPASDPSPR